MSGGFSNWPVLVGLQQRCLEARDVAELGFIIANETWHLLPYRQACVLFNDRLNRLSLSTVTGLVDTKEDSPFKNWIESIGRLRPQDAVPFTSQDLPEALQEGWQEWWPLHAVSVPLVNRQGRQIGMVLYSRDEPWTDPELTLLRLLHKHFAYCLECLQPRQLKLVERWQTLGRKRHVWLVLAIVLLVIALFPVRLSTLAPAEVISMKAEVVAAPQDGVIKTFHVESNQQVKAGQLLLSLDDTTLRNRRSVTLQSLAVARADALAAQQKAFDQLESKAELAALQGKVREREAELNYLDESLGRLDVVAPHAGVFVIGDLNDWIGRPVVTGERIAQLADPEEPGVMIWLAVNDAIALELGADIRVYLQSQPLLPLEAILEQTSYQATDSPEGVSSYRLRGRLLTGQDSHIGLRGVAKVYGERRPLIYWVMRRPLGALRQWLGL